MECLHAQSMWYDNRLAIKAVRSVSGFKYMHRPWRKQRQETHDTRHALSYDEELHRTSLPSISLNQTNMQLTACYISVHHAPVFYLCNITCYS